VQEQEQDQDQQEEEWQAEAQEEVESSSAEEEEEDTTGDTSMPTVWLRGPSRLPNRPIPVALRSLIPPCGDMYVILLVITTFSFRNCKITIETNILS